MSLDLLERIELSHDVALTLESQGKLIFLGRSLGRTKMLAGRVMFAAILSSESQPGNRVKRNKTALIIWLQRSRDRLGWHLIHFDRTEAASKLPKCQLLRGQADRVIRLISMTDTVGYNPFPDGSHCCGHLIPGILANCLTGSMGLVAASGEQFVSFDAGIGQAFLHHLFSFAATGGKFGLGSLASLLLAEAALLNGLDGKLLRVVFSRLDSSEKS